MTLAAIAVALVPLAWQSYEVLGGYFWQDDFRYVIRVIDAPLSLDLMFTEYGGHLMPGQFLLVWLITRIAPLNYPVAVLPLLLLHAAAAALMWRLLVRLFTARWALLVPFAAFTCSPVLLNTTRWWAYALQLLPLLVTMTAALDAHVRYVRDGGRTADLVRTLAWVVVGAFFWQKTLLVVPLLFALTALLSPERPPFAAVRWAARSFPRAWAAHGAVVIAGVIGYVLSTDGDTQTNPVDVGDWLALTLRMIGDTFVPGVLGGPWIVGMDGLTTWSVPPLPVRVVLWTLAAAVVVAGIRVGGRRAVLAWLTLAAYLAVDVGLVGAGRLWVIGSAIGGDPRYIADAIPVAVLCAAFAFLPPTTTDPAPQPVRFRPGVRAGLGALLAVLLVGAAITVSHAEDGGHRDKSRRYVAALRSALMERPGLPLYDRQIPHEIMNGYMGTGANVSELVKTMPRVQPTFEQAADDMHIVDDEGTPRPVDVEQWATAAPGPAEGCGYNVSRNPVEIRLSATVPASRLVVRISYFTGSTGGGVVRAGGREVDVEFIAGGPRDLFVIVDNAFDSITLWNSTATASVCVGPVVAGVPKPRD